MLSRCRQTISSNPSGSRCVLNPIPPPFRWSCPLLAEADRLDDLALKLDDFHEAATIDPSTAFASYTEVIRHAGTRLSQSKRG